MAASTYHGTRIPRLLPRTLRRILRDHERALLRDVAALRGTAGSPSSSGGAPPPSKAVTLPQAAWTRWAGPALTTLDVPPVGTMQYVEFLDACTVKPGGNLRVPGNVDVQPGDALAFLSTGGGRLTALPSVDVENQVFIPARRYGARPDTGADMTTAIQRAFDSCPLGATLVFEPGTYVVSADLTLSRNVNVWAYDAIFDFGTSVLTTAGITIGVATGLRRITWLGGHVKRTFTAHSQTSLLSHGFRLLALQDSTLREIQAEGFLNGIYAAGSTAGVQGLEIDQPTLTDCRFGITFESTGSAYVNDNLVLRSRHENQSSNWTQAELEDATNGFEMVRILFAAGGLNVPNNNSFVACNLESFNRRKVRCEGQDNYFLNCRWEKQTVGAPAITIGEATRANSNYSGNVFSWGNELDTIVETAGRIEFLDSGVGLNNRNVFLTRRLSLWAAGAGAALPALRLSAPGGNTDPVLQIAAGAFATPRVATTFRGVQTFGGINFASSVAFHNTSGNEVNWMHANDLVLGAQVPVAVQNGIWANRSLADADSRISGLGETNLTYWDASTNRMGIGTATPNRKLEVQFAGGAAPGVRLVTTGASATEQILELGSTGGLPGSFGWRFDLDELTTGDLFLKRLNGGAPISVLDFGRGAGQIGFGGTIDADPLVSFRSYAGQMRLQRGLDLNFGNGSASPYDYLRVFSPSFTSGVGVGLFLVDPANEGVNLGASNMTPQARCAIKAKAAVAAGTMTPAAAVLDASPGAGAGNDLSMLALTGDGSTFGFSYHLREAVNGDLALYRHEGAAVGTLSMLWDRSLSRVAIAGALRDPAATLDCDGGAVFNDSGAAVDFRVESDTLTSALHVKGSGDLIGIGADPTGSPMRLLVGNRAGLSAGFDGGIGDIAGATYYCGDGAIGVWKGFQGYDYQFLGRMNYSRVQVAGTYTVTGGFNGENMLSVDTVGAARTINLPTAASAGQGSSLWIYDQDNNAGTNNITIVRNGTNTIDGVAANLVLNRNGQGVLLISDGTSNWEIAARKTGKSAAYTPTNVTTDRSYDANATSVDELADVLGTLIADLQAAAVIG